MKNRKSTELGVLRPNLRCEYFTRLIKRRWSSSRSRKLTTFCLSLIGYIWDYWTKRGPRSKKKKGYMMLCIPRTGNMVSSMICNITVSSTQPITKSKLMIQTANRALSYMIRQWTVRTPALPEGLRDPNFQRVSHLIRGRHCPILSRGEAWKLSRKRPKWTEETTMTLRILLTMIETPLTSMWEIKKSLEEFQSENGSMNLRRKKKVLWQFVKKLG